MADIEVLAPGGSVEGMKAALACGADAVYMGGSLFGARAYADNPDTDALCEAIDYCHLHDRKLYLTVNTLLKQRELEGSLYDFIRPVYEHGLDAVLVQDLGVLSFLRREFPDLPIHASTQMSVQSADGAALLASLGASRIVPARELSLDEIRQIHASSDIEIECFVHGALCCCYSGQCLMSSLIGGRSGNRGRCAQPCRKKYGLSEYPGRGGKSQLAEAYLLSPKDICTLDILPELIDAGVCSFKIEGRMKRSEYAAGVTAVYRHYVDLYLHEGSEGYRVDPGDVRRLMDLYNRGAFSGGYYHQWNGADMMALDRPNHAGTRAADVIDVSRSQVRLKAAEPLHAGDVLEIDGSETVLKQDVPKAGIFSLPYGGSGSRMRGSRPGRERRYQRGRRGYGNGKDGRGSKQTAMAPAEITVRRVRSEQLLSEIRSMYTSLLRRSVSGYFAMQEGVQAVLTVVSDQYSVTVRGGVPEKALNRGTSTDDVRRQLNKTGETPFVFDILEVQVPDGLYLPIPMLNAMRREALSGLEQQILAAYARSCEGEERSVELTAQAASPSAKYAGSSAAAYRPIVSCFVTQICQLPSVLSSNAVTDVIIDSLLWLDGFMKQQPGRVFADIHEQGKRVILAMPPIWRSRTCDSWQRCFDDRWYEEADGVMLRCMDQIPYAVKLKNQADKTQSGRFEVRADHSIYSWNKRSCQLLKSLGIEVLTVPIELSRHEIRERGMDSSELVIYGHQRMMTSAQCVKANAQHCTHVPGQFRLADETGAAFPVFTHCGICTNLIYNHLPLDLGPCFADILPLHAQALRVDLTVEDGRAAEQILSGVEALLADGRNRSITDGNSTRGLLIRGTQ